MVDQEDTRRDRLLEEYKPIMDFKKNDADPCNEVPAPQSLAEVAAAAAAAAAAAETAVAAAKEAASKLAAAKAAAKEEAAKLEAADACPWKGLREKFTRKDCPLMMAAVDELDEKFRPGVAYSCRHTADGVWWDMDDAMLDAIEKIKERVWGAFQERVPGRSLHLLYACSTVNGWRTGAGPELFIERIAPWDHPLREKGWRPWTVLNSLCELEQTVSREAKPLERIVDLEKRLATTEFANAELLKRLTTLEKLLL